MSYTTSTAKIIDKSIIISYVPASQEDIDIIEEAGGIFEVYPRLIQTKLLLEINGKVVAEGTPVSIHSEPTITFGFLRPERTEWERSACMYFTCYNYQCL